MDVWKFFSDFVANITRPGVTDVIFVLVIIVAIIIVILRLFPNLSPKIIRDSKITMDEIKKDPLQYLDSL